MFSIRSFLLFGVALLVLHAQSQPSFADEKSYDPLAVPKDFEAETVDFSIKDAKRDREIPCRVYLPTAKTPTPVVIFSHGLGGAKENGPYLGNHWAARGYTCVFLQHQGSDDSVWRDKPLLERLKAMKEAANGKNFMLRMNDVPAAIDQLEKWNKTPDHVLYGRLDLEHIGMTGHSFGAITTQGVSGQSFLGKQQFTDPRIKAAAAMSPSSPARGDAKKSFGDVKIPWLLLTGTQDTSPISDTDVESRLAVFPALPPGGKYEVVLFDGQHSAFSDRALPGDRGKRNPNHHKAIMALTTAFWDSYLKEDPAAKAWLDGDGPKSVLEKDDTWKTK